MLFPSRARLLRTVSNLPSRIGAAPIFTAVKAGKSFIALCAAVAIVSGTALAQRPLGIDVSSYQGSADSPPTNINWTKVKTAGIAFAWAKATEGLTYTDADFAFNEANAKAAGVPIGAYHFAHPDTHPGTSGADEEAAFFISVAGPYIKTNGSAYLTPMLDAEVASPGTQAAVSAWVNEWCQDIVNYGSANGFALTPVVYTYQSWASSYLNSSVIQWPLWMASPNGLDPQTGAPNGTAPWSTWTLWQYGGGTISGIEGACDEDVFNGNLTAMTNALIIGHQTAPPPSNITNYWDPGGLKASPGSGGNGTWDNSTADWWHSGSSNIAWSTAGDYAIFSGTAGTVTLGASVAAYSLTFSNANYTIAGSDTLSLVSPGNVVVPTGTSNAITCVLGGAALNLSGGGILYLNNAGNFEAGETITGPNTTLAVPSDHPTGNDNVTMTLKSGGVYQDLDSTANDQFILPGCTVSLGSGGGIFENPNANLTMTNTISGSGSLTYNGGTRTLTVTNSANTYTGGTIVQAGTLKAAVTGSLGATTGALTVSGGTLDLGGTSFTAGTVTISGGTISDGTLTGSSYTGQSGTVSAVLAGSAAMTKTTSGGLTLSGANTYTGITTISSGLLTINADARLGTAPGSPVANSLTINSGTTTNNYGLRASASFALSSTRGITLGASGGQIQIAQNDTVTYGGVITGSGAFEMGTAPTIGEGVLVLSGANNYTGGTTIASGTLRLGANSSLPSGTPLTIASAAVGGTFDLNGFSQAIGSLSSSPGIGGTGTQTPTILLTGPLAILQNSTTTFSGAIISSGGSLTINGSGNLILNGTNTYAGNTSINAGTLTLGTTGVINNTAQISIAAGATLDVSAIPGFGVGGSALVFTGTSTPATIKAGATVSFGSQPITLSYDGSHPALTISQGTLSLNGNSFTINGSVLAPGAYTVIQQTTGSIAASGVFAVTGTAIGAGTTGAIAVSGGNVNLIVKANAAFASLTPSGSLTYGSPGITLGGTVGAPGPVYPAIGEMVSVTINGNLQTTTINDATGDFSINYDLSGIPANGAPYTVTYAYAGNATLTAANNTSTTFGVSSLPVILTGTRSYDGTNDAAAAILSVSNKVGSDMVTVASGSAILAGTNAGPQSITSVGTLMLGGAAAGNYTLTGATGTVTITASTYTFSITSATIAGSNFIFTWTSVPGSNYQVIGSTDPTVALTNWTNVGSPITATDTNTSATNPIVPPAGYFNIISQ